MPSKGWGMKRRGGSGPVSGPLEIRATGIGWQLLSIGCSALGLTRLARDRGHVAALVGLALLVLLVTMVALLVVRQLRLRAQGALLRLDDAGIALFDGRTVGWSEIGEVREVSKGTALAFFARGSAELPAFAPGVLLFSAEGVARRRTARYGTPLVLFPVALDATKEDIVAAVRRYGAGIALTSADGAAVTAQ
jgi:hypothetical protein